MTSEGSTQIAWTRPERHGDARRVVQAHKTPDGHLTADDYLILDREFGHLFEGGQVLRLDPSNEPTCPWITVDGHVHTAATWWLKEGQHEVTETSLRLYASRLASYISYALNECGLDDTDEFKSDVFAMADPIHPSDNLAGYRTWLTQTRPKEQGGTIRAGTWNAHLTVISQFHEALLARWGVPTPYTPRIKNGRRGPVSTTGLYLRSTKGSAGFPVHPEFVELLEKAALRIDKKGVEHTASIAVADRDWAYIQLGLASGMRLGGLHATTIYEIPDAPTDQGLFNAGLNQMHVPDVITKGQRGGVAFVLEWRIKRVRQFIRDQRRWHLQGLTDEGWKFEPANPLQIKTADIEGWEGVDAAGNHVSKSWNRTTLKERRRLVAPDGTPAMVFLSRDGTPLESETARKIVPGVADWAREHLDHRFPRLRGHDLRHTYTCGMALLFLSQWVENQTGESDYAAVGVVDALSMVSASLGHTSLDTTVGTYMHSFGHWQSSGVKKEHVLGTEKWGR